MCTLFDEHNPTDEIEWLYYQTEKADDHLLKVVRGSKNTFIGFLVNRFGDMEHVEKMPQGEKNIPSGLFEDFVKGDGW